MVVDPKQPKLVGNFIKVRRTSLGLSQRALGLLFDPPVTTQFISNVERGVTPLPPIHVPVLTRALSIPESELMALLEKEYTAKLSGRLGRLSSGSTAGAPVTDQESSNAFGQNTQLNVDPKDLDFMRQLYAAYRKTDLKTQQSFMTLAISLLKIVETPISE